MSVTSRHRSVPPLMFADETLIELPAAVRLTGIGLHFYADDEGRGAANPALLKGQLWPLDDAMTHDVIEEHLVALEDAGYIQLYTAGSRTLLAVLEWPSTDRGKPSRLPAPPAREDLATSSRAPREHLAVVEERGRRQEEGGAGGVSAGGGGARAGGAPAVPTLEPSPFCAKHQPYGTDQSCGPCGGARKRHEMWLRDQTDDASTDLDGSTER
jgi:hypothetical protein